MNMNHCCSTTCRRLFLLTALLVQSIAVSEISLANELFSTLSLGESGLRGLPSVGGTPDLTITHIGSATTQGDAVMNGPAARAAFNVDGSGITIGVISDSFNAAGSIPTVATQISAGDLPGFGNPNGFTVPVGIVNDAASGTDEGRAMLEIVHDVAPGATLKFHSAFNNFTDGAVSLNSIANAINGLVADGVDIIVDDVGLLNQPFFQDGPTAQAVNAAKAAGVAYFSAAGNSGTEAWSGVFNGGAGGDQDFDLNTNEGGDTFLNISVPNNGQVRVTVEWDDPYPSVGAPGNAADYDVALFDFGASAFVDTSLRSQGTGVDPWEIVAATNTSGAVNQYGLLIQHFAGDTGKLLKAKVFGSGSIADDDDTNDPTIAGHAAAEGAVGVAAHFHGSLNSVESFSSRGPTQILFDTAGNSAPDLRDTPLLTGPDGVATTTAGFGSFFGTSAAAPHVAAAAALVLERADDLGQIITIEDLYDILFNSAIDIELPALPGFDNLSGFGRLDLNAALASVVPEPSSLLLSFSAFMMIAARRNCRRRKFEYR